MTPYQIASMVSKSKVGGKNYGKDIGKARREMARKLRIIELLNIMEDLERRDASRS